MNTDKYYTTPPLPLTEARERFVMLGPKALSDHELVRLSVGSSVDAAVVEQRLLPALDGGEGDLAGLSQYDENLNPEMLQALTAAFELARRRIRPEGIRIRRPSDVLPLVSHLADRRQEHVVSISLNGAHEVIRVRTIGLGILTSCPVHPREVFVGPLSDRASAVILAHNHPSGDPTPSEEDRKVTNQIRSAGKILGIRLLDHIIFGKRGLFSFQESGEL